MNNILMLFQKEKINKIISGEMKYYHRDKLATKDIDYIYMCEWENRKDNPIVVGKVQVINKHILPNNEMWEMTKDLSGMTKDMYDKYFLNKEYVKAYEFGNVETFSIPHPIQKYGVNYPPMRFIYIKQ